MSEPTTMDEVRRNIDAIDDRIVALLAERWGWVREAARLKERREDIVDPARIEAVVAGVRAAAEARGLPPAFAERLWRHMIDGFIALETREFDRLHGEGPRES